MSKIKSLKIKLILIVILMVLASSMISQAGAGIVIYKNDTRNAVSQMETNATTLAEAIDEDIKIYELLADSVVNSYQMAIQPDINVKKDFLKLLVTLYGERYSILAFDYIDATTATSVMYGTNCYNETYYKQCIAGEQYYMEPRGKMPDGSKAEVFTLASPVKANGTGPVIGVINIAISSEVIYEKTNALAKTLNGNVLLLNKDGELYFPSVEQLKGQNIYKLAESDPKAFEGKTTAAKQATASNTVGSHQFKDETGINQTIAYTVVNTFKDTRIIVECQTSHFLTGIKAALKAVLYISLIVIPIEIVIIWLFAESIVRPIDHCVERMKLLADGDLYSDCPEVKTRDEIATLAAAMKGTVANLANMVRNTNLVLGEVTSGAEQVSGSSQALAQGATEQASAIEELSSTFAIITEKVFATSKNADAARDLSAQVKTQVTYDNEKMNDLTNAMSEISNASKEINKIIKTVDDIAFQTNILALNASVEAARAGSAGKGFAVVAEEVRNLASKSADAVKNTTILIENTLNAIEKGSKINLEVAEVLTQIVDLEAECSNLIDEIAIACDDQANSIKQASTGIEQISIVIQSNSSSAEESAAASITLSEQADVLKRSAAAFKTSPDGGAGGVDMGGGSSIGSSSSYDSTPRISATSSSSYAGDYDDKY